MGKRFQILIVIVAIAFAGCGSNGNNDQKGDTLMTDSAVLDTAMRTDTAIKDTGSIVY